jgi:hypothetical protein
MAPANGEQARGQDILCGRFETGRSLFVRKWFAETARKAAKQFVRKTSAAGSMAPNARAGRAQ